MFHNSNTAIHDAEIYPSFTEMESGANHPASLSVATTTVCHGAILVKNRCCHGRVMDS